MKEQTTGACLFIFKRVCLIFFLKLLISDAFAQCPVTATCTPGSAPASNHIFGLGIQQVRFGTINNSTGLAPEGYKDYSCTTGTTLPGATTHSLTVNTNANTAENVRAWIDFDNNGTFDPVAELVLVSDNKKVHTGNVAVPASAVLNQPLRLRIAADFTGAPVPTPCSSPQFSQTEDYSVTFTANTNSPAAAFTVNNTTTCSGTVSFTDQSTNSPSSWLWHFGDGTTSTLQNPNKTYTTAGTYTVSLKTCNAAGCDSIAKTNYITYNTNIPKAATCAPQTSSYCCGYGISGVTFGSMSNTSADGAAGYQDFSCSKTAAVVEGRNYTLSITTSGSNPQDTRVWIDYNNDGSFSVSEKVFEKLNAVSPSGTVTIPAAAVKNTALRMRVISDALGSAFTSCSGVMNGQAEDYTVVVSPNTVAPDADFSHNQTSACNASIQFTDKSQGAPINWLWDFGDGTTSTQQNPFKTYTSAGIYTVSLKSCNAFGCDSVSKTNTIVVTVPCPTYCAATNNNNASIHIQRVKIGTIDNISGAETGGYGNYTHLFTDMMISSPQTIQVDLRLNFTTTTSVGVWIDFNRNNIFEFSEWVVSSTNSTNSVTQNFIVPANALTGLTRMRVVSRTGSVLPTACSANQFNTEVEDYTVRILPNTLPPVPDFAANFNNICSGQIAFSDRTLNGASSWRWDFGDGTSSTLQNPVKTYPTGTAASYDVKLVACKGAQCDSVTKTGFVNIRVPCLTYCQSGNHNNTVNWISNVTFGNINNTTGAETNGYGNYTFLSTNLNLSSTNNPFTVTLNSNTMQNLMIWIDFNKDGMFQTTEEVYSSNGVRAFSFSGNITVPANAQLGRTRMRIIMHGNFNNTSPCINNLFSGETEDYDVNLVPNPLPTTAEFSANFQNICNGFVSFSDRSSNGATSWRWDFGDGNTSTQQNPVHAYSNTTPASYDVKLVVCKGTQCDSLTKQDFVTIDVPCLNYCLSEGHINTNTWIDNVTMGTVNNTSGRDANGYGNYTHLKNDLILGSSSNPITVTISSTFTRTVTCWIDFNKDGIFQTNEMQFSDQTVPASGTGTQQLLQNINVPANVKTGRTRMRLQLNNSFSMPDPCLMNEFDVETEDYSINILPNNLPVSAAFTGNFTNICNGTVNFEDRSANGATSWRWDFGDGNSSTLQNPTHTYQTATPAAYDVKLVACKGGQCDSVTRTNYVNITVPCLTYCQTSGHDNQNLWIENVTLGSLNNTTGAETNGYGNYLGHVTDLPVASASNSFSIKSSVNFFVSLPVAIWIDFNRDGVFQQAEQVFSGTTTQTANGNFATGNISVPGNATLGVTRMRVMIATSTFNMGPCVMNLFGGEVEDYTVNIIPNTLPIKSDFSGDFSGICSGVINFTDKSSNSPTSWFWDFGDGFTSTQQNPAHTYQTTTPASYDVKLITCKGTQCDTLTKTDFVRITVPCLNYCPSSGHGNSSQWITRVTSGTLDNITGPEPGGYGNYTNLSTDLQIGSSTQNITIALASFFDPHFISVWIDFNQDGVFQPAERIFSRMSFLLPSGQEGVTDFIKVPSNARLGMTRMRIQATGSMFYTSNPCSMSMFPGEVEDYLVNITPSSLKPVANFNARPRMVCSDSVKFEDLSQNGISSWLWDFGDGNSSSLANPSHLYQNATNASYTVKLKVCNANGCDSLTRVNYIQSVVSTPAKAPVCTPVTNNYCCGQGIARVWLNRINHASGDAQEGYQDYSCAVIDTLLVGSTYTLRVENSGSGRENVIAWIDYDNNGIFSPSTERVLLSTNATSHRASFVVPATAVLNTKLRMRVSSDGSSHAVPQPCGNNVNSQSEDYGIVILNTTGTSKLTQVQKLQIYPNPSNGVFTIRLPEVAEELELNVTNVLGETVLRRSLHANGKAEELQLNLSAIARGVYHVQLKGTNYIGNQRLIIE